jgi:hypothetical protein
MRCLPRRSASRPVRDKGYGYDANWLRQTLVADIRACIPIEIQPAKPIEHDRILYRHILYRQRHKTENAFDSLKGLYPQRGLAAHPHPLRQMRTYILPICVAAVVIFSSDQGVLSLVSFPASQFCDATGRIDKRHTQFRPWEVLPPLTAPELHERLRAANGRVTRTERY